MAGARGKCARLRISADTAQNRLRAAEQIPSRSMTMSQSPKDTRNPGRGYFRDKTVVVTGASSGIGSDVALAFGGQGANVALLARRRLPLEDLARKINKAGGDALALDCDVTDRARVFWSIDQVREAFGKVDILINSAGLLITGAVEEMPVEDLQRMMAVNVYGALNAMHAVLPLMRKAKAGNIVNISSLAGRRGVSPLGGYSATKFALVGMTEALRVELFGTGVRVSLVMPGVIDTPMARGALRHESIKGIPAMMAMPARWVTWAVLAAAAFGLTEVDVPPGAAVAEKLASLFPGVTDALLSVGTRILQGASAMMSGANKEPDAKKAQPKRSEK
jgi:NAD(P)-dependent dehydrogenase (short-subunit alcohol dehydrogenase family)